MSSSSSNTPKRPSFKNRMGTMMRRSSTALSFRSGSATPPPGGDSDTNSIEGRDRSRSVTTPPPTDRQSFDLSPAPKQEQQPSQLTASPESQFSPAPQFKVESESPESSRRPSLEGSISSSKPKVDTLVPDANRSADSHPAPSPIPESPLREAAAITEHTVGLSKLAHELKPEDIPDDPAVAERKATPPPDPTPAPAQAAAPASVHEEGFGAGERESQPKTQVVPPSEQLPQFLQPAAAQVEKNLEDVPVVLTQTPEQTSVSLPHATGSGSRGSIAPSEESMPYIPRTSTPPPFEGTGTAGSGSLNQSRSQSRDDLTSANVWASHAAQPQREQVQRSVSPSRQGSPGRPPVYIQRSTGSLAPSRQLSAKPSRSSLAPGGGAVGGNKDVTTYTWSNSSTRSLGMAYAQGAPGFGVPTNPFDDPSSSQVNLHQPGADTKSPAETIKVPEGFDPRSPHDDRPTEDPVSVPLPAASEVMLSRHSRELPEGYNVFDEGPPQEYFEQSTKPTKYVDQGAKPTNERLPLLGDRPYSPPRKLNRTPSIDTQLAWTKPKSSNGHGNSNAPSSANGNGHARDPSEIANGDGDLASAKRPLSHHHYPGHGERGYGAVSFPFAARGWAEHVLPHGARYFVHPGVRAVADADLRRLVELDVVSGVVGRAGIVPDGCEMWIREVYPASGKGKKKGGQKGWAGANGKGKARGEEVEVCWVDHRARKVSRDVPGVAERAGEEDRLDDEYRYWSFVESHPSHVHPRPDLRQEALDALRWSYTDQLLSYPQPVPSPFSPDECMQLERLLSANGLVPERNTVQTRLIARILLRVVHWRQQHFRPNKPLPEDVPQAQAQLALRRRPSVLRTLFDILLGIVCLGIPFMFENKTQPGSVFDIEGGALPHHAGSMFVAGGVACLVAAIILSASVTLITLPGIDEIARIAGIIAIACSVASMISAFAVIFRYKAEVYHARGHGVAGASAGMGGEGFVVLSKRSVLLSLPLAFLAYSVAGFVTGILVYSFKSLPGATVSLPVIPEAMGVIAQGLPTRADVRVESWSRWTALGALGGLTVAVLATAYAAKK